MTPLSTDVTSVVSITHTPNTLSTFTNRLNTKLNPFRNLSTPKSYRRVIVTLTQRFVTLPGDERRRRRWRSKTFKRDSYHSVVIGITRKIMCMRASRSVEIFFEGELCAEMPSVSSTADFLMLHDPKGRGHSRLKKMLDKACENGSELFGFTFKKDVNWVPSRPVCETNILTGDKFISSSVNEMGKRVFGPRDVSAAVKITSLCKSGGVCDGFRYEYVNDSYYKSSSNVNGSNQKKTILQIENGVILRRFQSLTEAANYIFESDMSKATSIISIKNLISACANFNRYLRTYLSYTWRYE